MTNLEQIEIPRVGPQPKVYLPTQNGFREQENGFSCIEQVEPLRPNQTVQIMCDIDHTLIDQPSKESPKSVAAKVDILNQHLLQWSNQTNKQIVFSLLTQKPNFVFTNTETAPVYAPLLNINSIRKGKSANQNCLVTIPVSDVYCELGAVTHITDPFTGETQVEIDAAYQPTKKLIENLSDILQEHFCNPSENSPAKFRLEPGNIAYTSLQLKDGTPMSENLKSQTKKQLIDLLTQLNRADIINSIDFITEHNDLDCLPHLLTQRAKAIGVHSDIFSKHKQGYPWFGLKDVVIIDDKSHAAGKAAEEILNQGGSAITMKNGDQSLKEILNLHQKGYISPHFLFLGVIDGLNHFFTNKPLSNSQVEKIGLCLYI